MCMRSAPADVSASVSVLLGWYYCSRSVARLDEEYIGLPTAKECSTMSWRPWFMSVMLTRTP